ncbi:hypothetical protein CHU68_00840 [Corynebacterium sp. LK11]|nr:hypothetical protein CHU68_00840 [Corynebacterium sp. LK11]
MGCPGLGPRGLGAAVEFRTNIKIGTDLDKAGIKSLPGQQRRVPLHQLALSAHGLTPGEAQAVLSMVRGCGCKAARLREAWVIHTLKVVHRLDVEPLSQKIPWAEKA